MLIYCALNNEETKVSFEHMYNTYKNTVYYMIRKSENDNSFCDDIMQEIFVKFYKSMGREQGEDAARRWLMTIAHSEIINYSKSVTSSGKHVLIDLNECEFFDTCYIFSDEDLLRLGGQLPPEDMYDRIMKACKGVKQTKRHNIKRIVVIAAIAAVLAGGTAVVAKKFFRTNFRVQKGMNSVNIVEGGKLNKEGQEIPYEETVELAEGHFGYEIAAPEYIPEGFYFEEIKTEPEESVELLFLNSGDGKIRIDQEIKLENYSIAAVIDSASINTFTEAVGNYEVLFVEYMQDEIEIPWVTAMWSDDKMSYRIRTTVEKEDVKKIVLSMQ